MEDLPGSVLFACGRNAIRSPMAECILKHYHGRRIFVDSVGARPDGNGVDPFAVAIMAEMGLDLSAHKPKGFDELEDDSFDLIITLEPMAQHRAIEMTRTAAVDLEYWPTPDPTAVRGSRDQRMEAYRDVRQYLIGRILERFPLNRMAPL
jgi:protein-tyrosine-phosphatase